MLRRALLIVLLSAAAPAWAADPVGIWTLDRKAWDVFVAGLAPKILASMPKEQVEALESRGVDVAAEIKAGLSEGIEGSVDLRPDGRVITVNRHGDQDGVGVWRNDGARIEIELPAERMMLQGTWKGDRMELKPVLDDAAAAPKGDDALWTDAVRQMRFVLVRTG